MTEKKYVLTEKVLNAVLSVLGKLPAEQVYDLITALRTQTQEYIDPADGPKLDKVKKK